MKKPVTRTNIDFLGKRNIAFVISVVLMLASAISIATRGLNFGVDFTGGVVLEVGYDTEADLPGIRSSLAGSGFADAQVQKFGAATDVLIRMMPRDGIDADALAVELLDILRAGDESVQLRRVEFVGPQVGEELTERGGTAMIFALLMILIYIMLRFQWKFAVGSVAALMHDVLIVIGLFSIFQFPFDLSVLAAVLAVIGYSLNDTIVVFDRIRENFREIRRGSSEEIMNISTNQMLVRSLITSGTTMLVLLALFFLGGEAVRGFSLALLIGIFVGTYSSIYVAGALALVLDVKPVDLMPPRQEEESVDSLP